MSQKQCPCSRRSLFLFLLGLVFLLATFWSFQDDPPVGALRRVEHGERSPTHSVTRGEEDGQLTGSREGTVNRGENERRQLTESPKGIVNRTVNREENERRKLTETLKGIVNRTVNRGENERRKLMETLKGIVNRTVNRGENERRKLTETLKGVVNRTVNHGENERRKLTETLKGILNRTVNRGENERRKLTESPKGIGNRVNNEERSGTDSPKEGGIFSEKRNRSVSTKPSLVTTTQVAPLPECPDTPSLNGKEQWVSLKTAEVTYEDVAREVGHVVRQQRGGRHVPVTCRSRERLAVIVPYRDRESNLYILLGNLIPFLALQQADFTIFVVEQTEDYLFNRCLMFNVGYVEAMRRGAFTCFILHDTDLVPLDFRNLYRCSDKPRHLMLKRSNAVWSETLPYQTFIGGVLALRPEHIRKVNGCSNSYYGWGLEDDDLQTRLAANHLYVKRNAIQIGSYYSMNHSLQKKYDQPEGRKRLVKTMRQRMPTDGLNSLNHTLVAHKDYALYTWLLVKPPPPPADTVGNETTKH